MATTARVKAVEQVNSLGFAERSRLEVDELCGLELTDLLNDLERLAVLLLDEVELADSAPTPERRREHHLDAFLLAAGMNQVAEDHIHRSVPLVEGLAARAGRQGPAIARLLYQAGAVAEATRRLGERGTDRWLRSLEVLVAMLARSVAGETENNLRPQALAVAREIPGLAHSLRREILRLPDSFRAFDQQPDDCRRLAEKFMAKWPDLGRPLLVVGVRTSGSYLAPLQAAYLTRSGFAQVDWMTLRPGQPWTRREGVRVRDLRDRGGLAVIVDDPPVTGGKLVASAARVERLGLPSASIVLLVSLLGEPEALPHRLRLRQTVTLPWSQWAINDQLSDEALRETLSRLLVGRTVRRPPESQICAVAAVEAVQRVELEVVAEIKARPLVRSHLRAAIRVSIRDETGRTGDIEVYVKGTGLGYFGRHSRALGRRLDGLVPEVYGWHNGLLFRAMLSEGARLSLPLTREAAISIAAYVAARAGALPAVEDKSARLRGRHAAWEMLGDFLGSGFAGVRPLARRLLMLFTRRLLRRADAAIIDGSAAVPNWFVESTSGSASRIVKADFDERAFSVWDLYSYDPVLDLATAAADAEYRAGSQVPSDAGGLLKAEYERLTGESISEERWLLYRVLHLVSWQRHFERLMRDGPGQLQNQSGLPAPSPAFDEPHFREALTTSIEAGERALSRILNAYVARLYIGQPTSGTGRICAIAVEGLLESTWLKSGSLTSDGGMVLRSLLAHGFRPLLVTSRSLEDLRPRCTLYHAAGGVAGDGETVATEDVPAQEIPVNACLRSRAEVTALVGHAPGGCQLCQSPALSLQAKAILAAVDASEARGLRHFISLILLARVALRLTC